MSIIVLLVLIPVLLAVAFVAFIVDAHINNICTIQLAERAAERDKLAAGLPSIYQS